MITCQVLHRRLLQAEGVVSPDPQRHRKVADCWHLEWDGASHGSARVSDFTVTDKLLAVLRSEEGTHIPSVMEIGIYCLIFVVVYVRGSTPVKIFFRLCLQNLFPGVDPQTFARVEAMVSMSGRCSKGGGYGFNVGALF